MPISSMYTILAFASGFRVCAVRVVWLSTQDQRWYRHKEGIEYLRAV